MKPFCHNCKYCIEENNSTTCWYNPPTVAIFMIPVPGVLGGPPKVSFQVQATCPPVPKNHFCAHHQPRIELTS